MRHWWWLCLLPALSWADPLKLAVPGLSSVDLDAQRSIFLAEHLAQQLSDEGAEVVSSQDLTVLLGLDRQRQLLGCTGGKCVTELTSTLGVDALVTGDVALLKGDRYQLNLRMLDATTGRRVKTYTKRVVGFETLLDEMEKAAKGLVRAGNKKFGRTSAPDPSTPRTEPLPPLKPEPVVEAPPPTPKPEPQVAPTPPPPESTPAPTASLTRQPRPGGGARKWAWVPAAAGGVALGGGVLFWLGAESKYKDLTGGQPLTAEQAQKLRDDGKGQQNLARIGLGVGTALLLTGGAMALFGGPDTAVEPRVAVGRDHVSLGLAGELPW
jgi:hypothetical protein